jgi:hypothetical protein
LKSIDETSKRLKPKLSKSRELSLKHSNQEKAINKKWIRDQTYIQMEKLDKESNEQLIQIEEVIKLKGNQHNVL